MKIIIECEDELEAKQFLHSPEAWGALRDIDNALRNTLKYGEPKDYRKVIEDARSEACEVLGKLE